METEKRERKNLLIGCSGSVAAVKIPEICARLSEIYNVKLVLTNTSKHFISIAPDYNADIFREFLRRLSADSLEKLKTFSPSLAELIEANDFNHNIDANSSYRIEVLCDEDEWVPYKNVKHDPVLHIELRRWADALLLCPLSAHTLAKISNGLCDNLLTCVFRAWNFDDHIFLCPAMNTQMWDSPFTFGQLNTLRALSENVRVVEPVSKELACGDIGKGALANVNTIVDTISATLL